MRIAQVTLYYGNGTLDLTISQEPPGLSSSGIHPMRSWNDVKHVVPRLMRSQYMGRYTYRDSSLFLRRTSGPS